MPTLKSRIARLESVRVVGYTHEINQKALRALSDTELEALELAVIHQEAGEELTEADLRALEVWAAALQRISAEMAG